MRENAEPVPDVTLQTLESNMPRTHICYTNSINYACLMNPSALVRELT